MNTMPLEPAITDYLYRKASKAGIPLSGSFELTPLCNMDCRMCYVRMSKEDQEAAGLLLSAADWIRIGEAARARGMLYLLLTGGEPFTRPDLRQILEAYSRMGLIFTLNSNATLIDEETIAWLKTCPPFRVNMTLYGASDETYAALCRHPGGYSRVRKAIDLLRDAGIFVKLNCSLTPANVHDLEAMIRFAEKEDLIFTPTSYMFPPIRKDIRLAGKSDRFTAEETAYYTALSKRLMMGREAFRRMVESRDFHMPFDPEEDCLPTEGEGLHCRAGKCAFWVTWNGRMLPCGMLNAGEGPDLMTEDFDSCWEKVRQFAKSIRLPAECAACEAKDQCRACAAMVLAETGSYTKVPDYRCRMTAAYPGACREIMTREM